MESQVAWMVAADPGWRALFGIVDEEVARSRIIGWAGIQGAEGSKVVGMIVDPSDPTQLVPAPDAIDPNGGELMRYGFAG